MLEIRDVVTAYGKIEALKGVSLDVAEGSITCLLGPNGAGKTTLMMTIAGVLRPRSGAINFLGKPLAGLKPDAIVARGIALVPENRLVFPSMTVQENLLLGAYKNADRAATGAALERVFALFPRIADRRNQGAATLSGGEQQMVAIGRALMAEPRALAIDELSLGLAPMIVEQLAEFLHRLNDEEGVAILLVEQNALLAFDLCQRAYVLETGRVVLEGESARMRDRPEIHGAYLGGGPG